MNPLRPRLSRGVGFAPRSKPELAELGEDELRQLAVSVGVRPEGTKDVLIQRIEEQGVAYVADKDVQGLHRRDGDPDDPGYDPDAQAIGDETLRTLPEGHPGWNDVADPAVIRKPDQADEAPTADHRAPETRDSGVEMSPDNLKGRAADTLLEHDSAEETEVQGEMVDVHPDSSGDDGEAREEAEEQEELRGQALDDALEAKGLSKSGTADEKRARLAEAG